MHKLKYSANININLKKFNTNSYYTSKLLYNINILSLFISISTYWTDYFLNTRTRLLFKLVCRQLGASNKQLKYIYFKTSQLTFSDDFNILTQYTPIDKELFSWRKVARLDKPVFLHLTDIIPMFKTFLNFNMSFSTKKSPTHADYRLLYIITHGGGVKFVSIAKMITR